jgi:nucleoside diphosphate kinase
VEEIDWDHTVFVLLAPDAFARHLGREVLLRLDREGFAPVAWTVLWQRPANLDAFHERNITQVWKAYLYRLVDRLFAFGPTVALLVEDRRRVEGETSHQRLRRLKGASEPAEAAPGTVRGDLRSVNVMLALMHSSDSPEDSRRESAVFTGGRGYTGGDPDGVHDLLGLMELAMPREERGYDEVLAGVRARIVTLVWDDLPPTGRKEAGQLLAGGAAQLAAVGAGARLAGLLPAEHPLAPVLACEFSAGYPAFDVDRARALLRAYGSDLDPWEDLVLATSQRFTPRRG